LNILEPFIRGASPEKRIPFKELKTHTEFGKLSKGEPFADYNTRDIYQSGDREHYIIRAVGAKRFDVTFDLKSNEDFIAFASELKQEYKALESEFEISVAPTNFVVGKSESERPDIWAVTEKVIGQNLTALKPESFSFREEYSAMVDRHFDSLFRYLETKFAERKKFMADVFINEQYVYGHTAQGGDSKLYMVDPEPQYLDLGKMDDFEYWAEHRVYLYQILLAMFELREECVAPLSAFTNVKNKIQQKYFELKAAVPEERKEPYDLEVEKNFETLLSLFQTSAAEGSTKTEKSG
jgi:hypothetical protein